MSEYKRLVESTTILFTQSKEPWKLRIWLYDTSFIDVFHSCSGKYSYHWERRLIRNTIYRHDNAPHHKWSEIITFPKHFHNESEHNIEESTISDIPEEALREFLDFVSEKLRESENNSN